MSLKDAYKLAHSAQCRLQMEASAPDRNLRFVVGHLMHYENLRLRIVEMEHAVDMSSNASAVKFQGTGNYGSAGLEPKKKPSAGQLGGRKSPPPPIKHYDPYDDDDIDDDDPWSGGDEDDDGEPGDDLGLQRFPSGTARPPHPPPDLIPDEEASDEDDEPVSPEEPDQETLEKLLQTDGSTDLANLYNGVQKCPCHNHQDAPTFEKMWELPSKGDGVTRAVAQVYV